MHSSICETYLVYWSSIDLCSIGGGMSALGIGAFFNMRTLFCVVVFHRSLVNWGMSALGICAFCYM